MCTSQHASPKRRQTLILADSSMDFAFAVDAVSKQSLLLFTCQATATCTLLAGTKKLTDDSHCEKALVLFVNMAFHEVGTKFAAAC